MAYIILLYLTSKEMSVLYIFFLFLPKMGKKRRKVSSLKLVLLALVRHLKRQNKEFHMYPHSKINCSVYIVLNKSKQTNPSDLTDLHRNNGTQHYLIFHARAVANCCGLNECTLHASSLSARFQFERTRARDENNNKFFFQADRLMVLLLSKKLLPTFPPQKKAKCKQKKMRAIIFWALFDNCVNE